MCNRCGYTMNPDGVGNCQRCGAPLSSKAEGGFNPRMAAQEQPELPAWLESLRVGERPAAPASNPSNPTKFSTADLIDEGTLPGWMRSGRSGMAANPPSDPTNESLAALSSSGVDAGGFPPKALNAQSLIDEQSLPSWMQEKKASSAPLRGMDASSLIQQDAIPDWMKAMSDAPSGRPAPKMSPALPPAPPAQQPPAASALFAAQPVEPAASALPLKNISPRDLIDEKSLPSWMTPQDRNAVASNLQPGSLSPSSLLDMDSLPPWLREGAQQNGAPPSAPQQSAPSWQASPAPAHYPGGRVEEKMSAASFVDTNALPEWLRSAAHPPGGQMPQGPVAYQQPVPYAVPPRVENVRVPNRPRTELAANESNEVAANVFASMLGVASTAPNFPGAAAPGLTYGPPNAQPSSAPPAGGMSGTAYGVPGQPAQMGGQPSQAYSGPSSVYNNGPSQAYSSGGPSSVYNHGGPSQVYNNSGPSSVYNNGPSQAYSSGYSGGSQESRSSTPAPYPANTAGGGPASGGSGTAGKEKSTKKRGGLVEALRDWLFP